MNLKSRILGKVVEPGICVKQLIDVCGFESQAQLYRYFKQYFNCTPKQLIERYQIENRHLINKNNESVRNERVIEF